MRATVPRQADISPDAPLRLSVAAALAFPDGSMTASGLRREGARGRLRRSATFFLSREVPP